MTAHNPDGSQSENVVSRLARGDRSLTRDPRTRRIVEYAHNHNGSTTSRTIAARTGWSIEETESHLQRLERENLIQLLGERDARIILLTLRGERLARSEEIDA